MPRQLPLDLRHDPSLRREDFLESDCNRSALALVDAWPHWGHPDLMLVGPIGAGKTHLAAIFQEKTDGVAIDLSSTEETGIPASTTALILDNVDRSCLPDAVLFHAINGAREAGVPLLMTARMPPSAWVGRLPDLTSRAKAIPSVEIGDPDDSLLHGILVKLFADRHLLPDPNVISFIIARMERSIDGAIRLVEALDREALAAGRGVTRPMASRILERLSVEGPEASSCHPTVAKTQ